MKTKRLGKEYDLNEEEIESLDALQSGTINGIAYIIVGAICGAMLTSTYPIIAIIILLVMSVLGHLKIDHTFKEEEINYEKMYGTKQMSGDTL